MANTAIGAAAPVSLFSPAADQRSVSHLRVTVQNIIPARAYLRLSVVSGELGFEVTVPHTPDRPPIYLGSVLVLEHPKGANPLLAPYTAIYPSHLKPSERKSSMSTLTLHAGTPEAMTMSTREIADLVGKQHSNIKISAERLAEKGVIGTLAMQEFTHNGNTYTEYLLCKRDSLILVAQNCPEFTARIVDRWQELEAKESAPPLNPANLSRLQLIEMALESEQERIAEEQRRIAAEHKVETLEPKALALDRIAVADGTVNPTVAAKTLQVPPKKLFDWMREHHWIYRRPGSSGNVAYQDKIQAGYLTHKITTVQREDGTDKVVEQVLVTGKGLAKLSQVFAAA